MSSLPGSHRFAIGPIAAGWAPAWRSTATGRRCPRLAELEAQQTRLGDLPPTAAAIPVLPSNLAASYMAKVRDLHAALADRDHPEALETARSLIEKVVVYPPETDNDPPRVELAGDLIALLQAGGVIAPQSGAQSLGPDGVLSMFVKFDNGGSRGGALIFLALASVLRGAEPGVDTARCKSVFCVHAAPPDLRCPDLAAAGSPRRQSDRGQDRYFVTSDGVRLHYLEAGPRPGHTIVFVPGWTMPAWIWAPQIQAFAQRYHVVAFDPRGQGDSDAPPSGYEPRPPRPGHRRTDRQPGRPCRSLLVGWSLGVLDTLAYVHRHGDQKVAGLVLVDNSVGEEPPPPPRPPHRPGPVLPHAIAMHRFVHGMFHRPQSDELSRPADRGHPAHARIRQPRAAGLSRAAHLLARRGVFHQPSRCSTWCAPAGCRSRRRTLRATGPARRSRCSPMPATRCSSTTRPGSTRCWRGFIARTVWP